jgi:hypothetical protein
MANAHEPLAAALPDDALRIVAKGEKKDRSLEFAPIIRISITSTAL